MSWSNADNPYVESQPVEGGMTQTQRLRQMAIWRVLMILAEENHANHSNPAIEIFAGNGSSIENCKLESCRGIIRLMNQDFGDEDG